jgi:hypothetical protein
MSLAAPRVRERAKSFDERDREERRSKRSSSEGTEQRARDKIIGRPIRVGICAMDGKARSTAMNEIMNRMISFASAETLEVVYFGNECILNQPVEEWPLCDALMSWFSKGFPLDKVEEYAALRQPIVVNDLSAQRILWDRRKVNALLKAINVPTTRSVVCDREDPDNPPEFEEQLDYIVVNGFRMDKPFVEKPVSGEDHNIYIYYASASGGGSKRLFRKIKNQSSQFYPDESTCRRDASYIYEEFVPTAGTDIKVYTVGSLYAHAEARKSPVVDGVVKRGSNGKEERFPILLKPFEKEIARKICLAFKQTVCGFDMLRSPSGTFVCDVNGWSFVKTSRKYWDDCAHILTHQILRQLAADSTVQKFVERSIEIRGRRTKKRTPVRAASRPASPGLEKGDESLLLDATISDVGDDERASAAASKVRAGAGSVSPASPQGVHRTASPSPLAPSIGTNEKLRCVIGVFRHGDRTPKEKLKVNVTWPEYLELFDRFAWVSKEKKTTVLAPATRADDGVSVASGREAASSSASLHPSLLGSPLKPSLSTVGFGDTEGYTERLRRPFKSNSSSDSGLALTRVRELKLKTPVALQAVLNATNVLLGPTGPFAGRGEANDGDESGGETELDEQYEKLKQVQTVLQKYGNFRGINRKVQLKPTEFDDSGNVIEAQLVLKWGGVLTRLGRLQAERLGTRFRQSMYRSGRGEILDVLRLHATHRHDLKIYASDEGRVLMTAAAFAKSFLDLEGALRLDVARTHVPALALALAHTAPLPLRPDPAPPVSSVHPPGGLTPVATTLINKAPRMLNEIDSESRKIMKKVKARLGEILTSPTALSAEAQRELIDICPTGARGASVQTAVTALADEHGGVLRDAMTELYERMSALKTHLASQLNKAVQSLTALPARASRIGASTSYTDLRTMTEGGDSQSDGSAYIDTPVGTPPLGSQRTNPVGTLPPPIPAMAAVTTVLEAHARTSSADAQARIRAESEFTFPPLDTADGTIAGISLVRPESTSCLEASPRVMQRSISMLSQTSASGSDTDGGGSIGLSLGSALEAAEGGKLSGGVTGRGSSGGDSPMSSSPRSSASASSTAEVESSRKERAQRRHLARVVDRLRLMTARWKELCRDFYSRKKDRFNVSKISDIYDCIKFDLIHHHDYGLEEMLQLYGTSRRYVDSRSPSLLSSACRSRPRTHIRIAHSRHSLTLALVSFDCFSCSFVCHLSPFLCFSPRISLAAVVVPQEYGMTAKHKRNVALGIAHHLISKIVDDLHISIHNSAIEEEEIELDPEFLEELGLQEREESAMSEWDELPASGASHTRIRTRLYFTSESHMYGLTNSLRFGMRNVDESGVARATSSGAGAVVARAAAAAASGTGAAVGAASADGSGAVKKAPIPAAKKETAGDDDDCDDTDDEQSEEEFEGLEVRPCLHNFLPSTAGACSPIREQCPRRPTRP